MQLYEFLHFVFHSSKSGNDTQRQIGSAETQDHTEQSTAAQTHGEKQTLSQNNIQTQGQTEQSTAAQSGDEELSENDTETQGQTEQSTAAQNGGGEKTLPQNNNEEADEG